MRFVIDARTVRTRPSGIGTYVEGLIERLPALAPRDQFRLWTHPSRPQPSTAPNASQRIVRASTGGLSTLAFPGLLDSLQRDDVIHLPHNLLGLGLRCATVVTLHDLMWLERPELVDGRPLVRRLRQSYYQAGTRWALRKATRLITVSRATADRVLAHAPDAKRRIVVTRLASRAHFVPAHDDDEARERAAAILGSPLPYYLVVGTNQPYKAHRLAVLAFARAALQEEQLVLVQRENPGSGLHGLVRELGIVDRVRWMPDLSDAELVALMQGARALLHPSIVEGFGLPVLEAMASGCPVITSEAPALVEVTGDAALHAPVGSADGIAEGMRRLRDGSRWQEMRARGIERAREFDWDETAKLTLAVYREAAGEHA
ncbi:MAG TPA: glycosyltransferase family 1 protein [Polyangiaceae bacterium]|jgi:glycosyltransferase involved in cell wall biosynthesis|nr:glycosyltransferase family 1 protein [Polyangiaceae bacterium]